MTKLKKIDEISRDCIEVIREQWNGDLGFSPEVLKALRASSIDQIDILEVVEDGNPIDLIKDEAHETLFELVGTTVSGKTLRVILSYNPHIPGFGVKEVTGN